VIKILIIGPTNKLGGIEIFVKNYISAINKSNLSFDILSMYKSILFEDEFKAMGCRIIYIPHFKQLVKYVYALACIMHKHKYDIVHINICTAANIIPVIISKLRKIKTIIVHSHNAGDNSLVKRMLHHIGKSLLPYLATDFFACSFKAGKFLFSGNNNFVIIPNAIDVLKFNYNKSMRNEIRKNLYISHDTCVIGHVGRFFEQKNHCFLINVFNKVLEKNNNMVLLLIGDGPKKHHIEKLTADLNISDKVIFYGISNTVNELYSAMDIFVLPSLYEGLGLVNIEAQCSGLPVIASSDCPKEIQITDLVKRIDLNEGVDKWADEILESLLSSKERVDRSEILTIAGYNILIESKKLEHIYVNLFEKHQ
jgi:glycosyltransferase involved in cell wall biosynthesis